MQYRKSGLHRGIWFVYFFAVRIIIIVAHNTIYERESFLLLWPIPYFMWDRLGDFHRTKSKDSLDVRRHVRVAFYFDRLFHSTRIGLRSRIRHYFAGSTINSV